MAKVQEIGPYAPLSAAIRPTASGNPVNITDSVEWPLQGLKVYGKSTQGGTPSPENPVPIVSAGDAGSIDLAVSGANFFDSSLIPPNTYNGVSCTVLDDGSMYLNGAATAYAVFTAYVEAENYVRLPQTFLTVSIHESGNNRVFVHALFRLRKDGTNMANFATTNSQTIDISGIDYDSIQVGIQVSPGENVSGNFKIMANVGQNPAPWSPYSGFQSLTVSTPNGLPGIHVDSGGNYTDVEGQQLVCNYKDYARGVYVQRCALEKIVGTPNFNETANYSGRYSWDNALTNIYADGGTKSLSTFGIWSNWGAGSKIAFAISGRMVYFNYLKSGAADEVNALFSNLIETNQCYVLGQLAAPAETPLSEEELAAYWALHTYDGATVVSTAEDVAGIEVRYVADGEKYIDRKISEGIASAAETKLASYDTLSGAIHEGVNEA